MSIAHARKRTPNALKATTFSAAMNVGELMIKENAKVCSSLDLDLNVPSVKGHCRDFPLSSILLSLPRSNNPNSRLPGLTDQNNKWKDCDCIDLTDEEEGYDAFSDADYDMWDRIKAALPPANSPGGGDKPRDHPSGNPTCGGNQVDSIPSQVTTDQGNKSPKDLQYMMREGKKIGTSNIRDFKGKI
jgi:hypothetical protein